MDPILIGTLGQTLLPPDGATDADPIAGKHELCGGEITCVRAAKCFNAVSCDRCRYSTMVFHRIVTFGGLKAMGLAWKLEEHVRLAEGRTTAWFQSVVEPLLLGDVESAKRAMTVFPSGIPMSHDEAHRVEAAWSAPDGDGPLLAPRALDRAQTPARITSAGRHSFGRG